jgi:hypothetical protein
VTDPLGAHVTGVVDYESWTGNGTCVTSASEGYGQWSLGATGWFTATNDPSEGWDCSDVWSENVEVFENNIFCANNSTVSYYDPIWAHGHPAGNLTYEGNLWQTGPCAGLLTQHVTAGFGSPPSP